MNKYIKTATAHHLITIIDKAAIEATDNAIEDDEVFHANDYRIARLQNAVAGLVAERDRLQGVILCYEGRDEKRLEDARDIALEIKATRMEP